MFYMGRIFATSRICIYRSVHSANKLSPFHIVYGFYPLTPLDLILVPMDEEINLDRKKKADLISHGHERQDKTLRREPKDLLTKLIWGMRKLYLNQEIRFGCI